MEIQQVSYFLCSPESTAKTIASGAGVTNALNTYAQALANYFLGFSRKPDYHALPDPGHTLLYRQ